MGLGKRRIRTSKRDETRGVFQRCLDSTSQSHQRVLPALWGFHASQEHWTSEAFSFRSRLSFSASDMQEIGDFVTDDLPALISRITGRVASLIADGVTRPERFRRGAGWVQGYGVRH